MDAEFKIHLQVLKFFNFDEVQTKNQRNFIILFQIFNVLIIAYCLFAHGMFIYSNYNDVFGVSECISPISLTVLILVKLYILCFSCHKFFDLAKEIKNLNIKCE